MPTLDAAPVALPPAVVSLVDGWWERTIELLSPRQPELSSPESRFAERPSARGTSLLRFHDIALSCGSTLRATRIGGKQVAIFNVMIFPHDAARVPIFASEIVAFGPAIRAAVIDLQAALPEGLSRLEEDPLLVAAASCNGDFPTGGPLPAWCADYFTRHALWSRELPLTDLDRLLGCYTGYLSAWLTMSGSQDRALPAKAQGAVQDYKAHHIAHSPGIAFLSSAFGAEWTHDFLREGMYA